MDCRTRFNQAMLKSRQLLCPKLFPFASYPKDRERLQNYVAAIILLHFITMHAKFKSVYSPLLIFCCFPMSIDDLKELIRTKFLLSNEPFILSMDEIFAIFEIFSREDGNSPSALKINKDEVLMTAMLCTFASFLLGYDVIIRGGSQHREELVQKIQQMKPLYPNLRTVLLQVKRHGFSNKFCPEVRCHDLTS